ncbi:pickpocket protein 28-like [Musca autumnalis]|uniref:pickpocket protein 28-like n=1 Tax=Musca autumnalis TaxID=221902 RepID=UPI003CFA4D77
MTVNEDLESTAANPPSKQRKTLRKAFKESFLEYSGNTALHGVPYFSQQRPLRENIFWLCVILLSVFYCATSVSQTFGKWRERPVIVSFSEKSVDISKIPFPAVTICPETKRPLRKGPSFNELFLELNKMGVFSGNSTANDTTTDKKLKEFLTLAQVCELEYLSDPDNVSGEFDLDIRQLEIPSIDYMAILKEMAVEIEKYDIGQWWSSHLLNATQVYTTSYTEEGLCYTFNALNNTDLYRENTVQYQMMTDTPATDSSTEVINRTLSWSMEHGYAPDSPLNTYPARVTSCGSRSGLVSSFYDRRENNDYTCRGPTQGFKLVLHAPDAVPSIAKRFVRIDMAKEVAIAVKPKLMQTSRDIAVFSPEKRQCYFNDERPLKFFKIYNTDNCELECLTNYTLKKCNCVRFAMPRTPDMPVCTLAQLDCYKSAEEDMLMNKFNAHYAQKGGAKGSKPDESQCRCLPSCTSLEYDMQISKGVLEIRRWILKSLVYTGNGTLPAVESAQLSIYFKNNQFIATKRSKLFTFYDLLSNCGGIGGLFIGFSLLSIAEVLFHFTMRFWANWKVKKE